jgi:GTP pyrophosphokinase
MNFFKSKMKRTGQTADADIHKQVLNSNDMLVLEGTR